MIKFICDHPGATLSILSLVGAGLAVLLGSLIGALRWFFKKELNSINSRLETFSKSSEKFIEIHYECQKNLPDKYASRQHTEAIFGKLDSIIEKMGQLPLIYRTKEEATKDWLQLERRLTELHGSINNLGVTLGDRHREMWEKINRVVNSFMFLTQLTFDRMTQIENAVAGRPDTEENLKKIQEVKNRIAEAMEEIRKDQAKNHGGAG